MQAADAPTDLLCLSLFLWLVKISFFFANSLPHSLQVTMKTIFIFKNIATVSAYVVFSAEFHDIIFCIFCYLKLELGASYLLHQPFLKLLSTTLFWSLFIRGLTLSVCLFVLFVGFLED